MGRYKEYWMERIEDRSAILANILGIANEELEQLDFKIEPVFSKEGIIYSYEIRFGEQSPAEIISKINRLKDGCVTRIQPWELEREYAYDEEYNSVSKNNNFVETYRKGIFNCKELSKISIPERSLEQSLFRQVYVSIIGSVETYLSDAFINRTLENRIYFRRFVRTHPEFSKRKFELKDIVEEYEMLESTVKKVMLDTIYHKLPTVRKMYIDTFEISFPEIKDLYQCVLLRHDLVHRNGKTKDSEEIIIDIEDIDYVIRVSNSFIEEIEMNIINNLDENDIPF